MIPRRVKIFVLAMVLLVVSVTLLWVSFQEPGYSGNSVTMEIDAAPYTSPATK